MSIFLWFYRIQAFNFQVKRLTVEELQKCFIFVEFLVAFLISTLNYSFLIKMKQFIIDKTCKRGVISRFRPVKLSECNKGNSLNINLKRLIITSLVKFGLFFSLVAGKRRICHSLQGHWSTHKLWSGNKSYQYLRFFQKTLKSIEKGNQDP